MFPYFRDFAILENYPRAFQVGFDKWDWNYLETLLYSLDKTSGRWFILIYYGIWMILGFYLNLRYLVKILPQSNFWFGLIWTGLYFINFWTIERVLMGHINLLKGHIMLIPILYYMLKGTRWWLKALLILWIGIISPHYLGFLVIIFLIIAPAKFWQLFLYLIPFVIWQFWRIVLDGAILGQVTNLQESGNRYNILRAMSPVVLEGEELPLRVLVGAGSWNTFSFSELNKAGLNFWYANFWANCLYGVGIFVLLISGLKLKKYWTWSILGLFGLIATFGQSLDLIKGWNWFVSSVPGMGLYRESGKFYYLLIFGLIAIGIQAKANWIHILAVFILILNLWTGINILSQVNLINYPIFDTAISNYCNLNPSLKKGIFLPNNIYIQTSFGNGIFGANHYNISSNCPFILPQNSQVTSIEGRVGYLLESPNQKTWSQIIKDLNNNPEICQSTNWWLEYLNWSQEYDFWAWDITYYQDLALLSSCLKSHGHIPIIVEGDMEFYRNFSRAGSAKL